MDNLTSLTATRILSLIRSRSVSAVEVLEAHLARVAQENERVNAVVTLDEEGARARARAADEAMAGGESWGPLHGLPMTLKDGHSTAGMLTTSGYKPLRDYVPAEDGTVAARLKAGGAIIFGKTNVSPLLGDIQSYNAIFGRTNNPYDVERTPGGSSGGAAAALAAGMTPLEVGSDLAGSIRIPSAFCGVYGLKTTEHRVSMWGHIPDVPGMPRSHRLMWSIGPMARSIEDLALCYGCIAGPDGKDMDVSPVPVDDISLPNSERRPFKLAWAPTFPGVPVSSAVREELTGVVRKLEGAGVHMEERLPDVSFEQIEEARVVVSRAVRLTFRSDVEHIPATLKEYLEALDTREKVTRVWEEFFGE